MNDDAIDALTLQDEYNDAREWMRLVRKGTRPRYMYDGDLARFSNEQISDWSKSYGVGPIPEAGKVPVPE